ncbi:MAG: class I SAM-dependent methyltransferase [Verrucomicrobia bacterium]|nr:class I SAM-dependent methyltransferase [Verrucomicrobiota bacterium]MCH8512620.1 class I SAM-dependent methyltransferase [Kiritimatiellia bacterium]
MNSPVSKKSTVDDIRKRFDADVERFSNLETGQSATLDAPLAMELITRAAVAVNTPIRRVLDLGCGAGNNTLKLRAVSGQDFDVDLLDLSGPMVDRAVERVRAVNCGRVNGIVEDFRTASLPEGGYDVILAAAVLHHLREDQDWEDAFRKIHGLLRKGGSLWITDLITQEVPAVHGLMWQRYGDYLEQLNGPEYREEVFRYIEIEDSPRPLTYQLDLLREVGFRQVDVLHKNSVFAAFGAVK